MLYILGIVGKAREQREVSSSKLRWGFLATQVFEMSYFLSRPLESACVKHGKKKSWDVEEKKIRIPESTPYPDA